MVTGTLLNNSKFMKTHSSLSSALFHRNPIDISYVIWYALSKGENYADINRKPGKG